MKYFLLLMIPSLLLGRSVFRIPETNRPEVATYWDHDPSKKHTLTNNYFHQYPLFGFNISDIEKYRLPDNAIPYGINNEERVSGKKLSALIEETLDEVKNYNRRSYKEKEFKYFTIIKDKNFSYRKKCGLLILKFKQYPFILKLFMEKPETITDPHATGFEPTIFFYMGKGTNRHLSGITRIHNRHAIMDQIATMPTWKNLVSCPRKWFWLPKDNKSIGITGINIAENTLQTSLPCIYGVIADAIIVKKEASNISISEKKKITIKLCNDLNHHIDPHFDNFIFVENSSPEGLKILIIDTEHFPTMIGMKEKQYFKNYSQWYGYMCSKCFKDMFLTTKDEFKKERIRIGDLALKKNPS